VTQGVFNEAFDKESSSEDDMFDVDQELERSHIQRLEVRISAISLLVRFMPWLITVVAPSSVRRPCFLSIPWLLLQKLNKLL